MADTHSPSNSTSSTDQQRSPPTQSSGEDPPLVSIDRLGTPGAKFLLAFLALTLTGGILIEVAGLNSRAMDVAQVASGFVAAVAGGILVVLVIIDSVRTYRRTGYGNQSTISDFDTQRDNREK